MGHLHGLALSVLFLITRGVLAVQSPNFLFFITDDQDVDLGSFEVMPTARSLFAQGLNFTSAYAASPVCCPSRTSMFTGRHPHNIGDTTLGWCGNFSAQRDNTFFTSLSRAGYRIGHHGKWYNEEPEFCQQGYVPEWKAKGSLAVENDFFVMCEEVKYYNITFNDNGELRATGDKPKDYLTSVIGNRTMAWLRNATAAKDPWFEYVAVHAPHLPATPAPWHLNSPVPGFQAPRTPNFNKGWEDKHWQINNGISVPMSEALINGSDTLWMKRLRCLMAVDDLLKDILDLLAQTGAMKNTYVLYTSDHGYHLGQHGVWSEKAGPYESDARIPLTIVGPGIQPSTSEALVTLVDIAPTLLELAGIPNEWPDKSGRRDGKSLVPLLNASNSEAPANWRDRLLVQWIGWGQWQWLAPCSFGLTPDRCGPNPHAGLTNAASNCYTSLRIKNSTTNTLYAAYRPPLAPLHSSSTNWTEAYDLHADPWQFTNLAVNSRLPPAQLEAMREELWAVANCVGAECP